MKRYWPYVRWLWTLAILTGVFVAFGQTNLLSQLAELSLPAISIALGLFTLQVVLSAWRWRYTARQLGLPIGGREAVREYYLATVTNQVLPGGVLGDANRALRHGNAMKQRTRAIQAVIIERLSGQVVLAIMAVAAWLTLWPGGNVAGRPSGLAAASWPGGVWVALIALAALGMILAVVFRRRLCAAATAFRGALWAGLLRPDVFAVQLLSSSLVVGSYVLVFVVLAWGMDATMPQAALLPAVLCLLLTMVIPLTVAGWGIREGAAGALWLWAGYPAAEGLALSIAYGLLFLISSLPGLLYVLPGSQDALRRMSNR